MWNLGGISEPLKLQSQKCGEEIIENALGMPGRVCTGTYQETAKGDLQ